MSIELLKLLANGKTTDELVALLDGFKKQLDQAYIQKDLVMGEHAQNSIEVITEILVERNDNRPLTSELLELLASGKTNEELISLRKEFSVEYRIAARSNDKFALEHARNLISAIWEIVEMRKAVNA